MPFISKEELNNQKLLEVYKSAYMEAEMDDDGEIKCVVDGFRLYANVMPDRPFFVLRTMFTIKPEAQRAQILELCNRLNDHMIMIRCCLPDAAPHPTLYIDHFTMTEGGISGEEIVGVTRRFMKVITDGISEYDTDDIMA
ncbi:MAG: hypothetical protein FDZ70_06080 [Actinobacteria bacterium]|nr:MAG: hypothetical protein FDZ70_06080 [Actinomycetota bacterium]